MDKSQGWPPAVAEYLRKWIVDSRSPAYLMSDGSGRLVSRGGALARYGLDDLREGQVVTEKAYFLEGLLPVDREPLSLFRVEAMDGVFADIHLFRVGQSNCVLLLDASADVAERARIEQALRQTEERLRHAEKMEALGRLAGGVAHDFNNLLTIILGYSNMLAEEGSTGDPAGPAREITLAAERATAMTQRLLSFSRRRLPQPEVLDLNQLISSLEQPLRRLIGEDIILTIVLSPDLDRVEADRGQLEQVLMNLVANARDAMPAGGRLEMRTDNVAVDEGYREAHQDTNLCRGSYVRMAVSDSGCGMDAETRARAFEPFFTSKPAGRGTGLGLSIVYGIVTQAGGDVELTSEIGRGTRIEVLLPPAQAAIRVEEKPGQRAPASGTETILVVEDEEAVRNLVGMVLNRLGYTVLECAEPGAAIALSGRHPGRIDLLLTDVVLPGMHGSELARCICANRPEMRVLYASGYALESFAQRGVRVPGSVFLEKPFTPSTLAEKIREALSQRSHGESASGQRS